MKVKINDSAEKLLQYVASGLISNEQFKKLVEKSKPYQPGKDLITLSLLDFQNFANEQEKGEIYGLFFLLEKLDNEKRPQKAVKKMTAQKFLMWLKYIKVSLERIDEHFKSIPKVPMSALVEKATKPIFDFGIYAIVDNMAVRHGITDEQAEQMPLVNAITKMKIDGERAVIRYRVEKASAKEARIKAKSKKR